MSYHTVTVGEVIERLKLHYKKDEIIIAQWYTKDDLFIFSEEDSDYLTKKVWKKVAGLANPDYIWQYSNDAIEELITQVIDKEIRKAKRKAEQDGKAQA